MALCADLLQNFVHRRNGALLGIDLALNRGVGNHLAVLVQNNCLGVGGTNVATAEILHEITLLRLILIKSLQLL